MLRHYQMRLILMNSRRCSSRGLPTRTITTSSKKASFSSPTQAPTQAQTPIPSQQQLHQPRSNDNPFISLGYPEPFEFEDLNYSVRDLKKIMASLNAHDTQSKNTINLDQTIPTQERDPEATRTTFLNSYRTTKAADYMWALRQNLNQYNPQDIHAMERLQYLETSMYSVNDHQRPIVSVDIKLVRGSFRELGIAIYDPKLNISSLFPNIKRIHVIAQEFFGVLSTNTFHGQSMIIPQKEMVKFTRAVLQHYFKQEDTISNAVLAGFNIPQKLETLKETCSHTPTDINSLLDAYYVYITPSLFRNDILDSGIMNSTSLPIILDRLSIPHSEITNVGNRAYFTLVSLLKLLNPYNRLRLKLDDPMENLKFQEKRMLKNMTNGRITRGERSPGVDIGSSRPNTPVRTVSNFKEALSILYN